MGKTKLGGDAWSLALIVALVMNVACAVDKSDMGSEPLTLAQCNEQSGEALGQDSCPGGRDELGPIASEGGGICCEMVPLITPEQCESQGGTSHGDPGDGSTHRDGCPSGQDMLGELDFGIEGGICCR